MYAVISAIGTPLILMHASINALEWLKRKNTKGTADIQLIFDLQCKLNIGIPLGIFGAGVGAVGAHAYKFQNPTPLILSAMCYRLVAITFISYAMYSTGMAVTYYFYRDALDRAKKSG